VSDRRPNRSEKYQHLIVETSCPHEMLEAFSNEDSIYKRLNPFSYNEQVSELEEQLRQEFWRIVETQLTTRQKEVLKLYSNGYTQQEIAKKLGVNQSSITKCLNGNVDYKNGRRSYGGAKRKIQKLIQNDPKIQEILKKIAELRDENWL